MLVGRDLVDIRENGWVYCMIIVPKGDVDGLYMIGVHGVEVLHGALLSS